MDSQQLEYWAQIQNHHYLSASDGALELPPDLSQTPSLSASPEMSEFESFASPTFYQASFPHMGSEDVKFPFPVTPSEFGSADDSYSNPIHQMKELAYPQITSPITSGASIPLVKATSQRGTVHATSGRRRAQNRAAQRAFRERKEKHARDLEEALSALTAKYQNLETSHSELSAAYEKLRKMIELLTKDDDGRGEEAKSGHSKETLRKLLEIIHGEVDARGAIAKE